MAKKFKILVKTGDQHHAGTDANVHIILEDGKGFKTSSLLLDIPLHNDLERGTLESYNLEIPTDFDKIAKLFISRDTEGYSDDWFCDYIIIQDPRLTGEPFRKVKNRGSPGTTKPNSDGHCDECYFPIHRWVQADQNYEFASNGTCLPQLDPSPEIRENDISWKKKKYYYKQNMEDGPMQIANLPSDEKFSEEYYWTFAKEKLKLLAKTKFTEWTKRHWKSLDELRKTVKKSIGEPKSAANWHEDWWFALQRVQGVNPLLIQLCEEIPEKLGITNDHVCGLMEDFTLEEAVEKKKIFFCDLKILENLPCKDNRVIAEPIAVFYLNKLNELVPIAIQLMQHKGPDNPIFTPKDARNTWIVAKMYYNNAEAQHHQGVTHLGLTHLLMEGICICTHRNLSPSHPMFKLMAPHFLFLMAINWRGLEKLIAPGGWVDGCMTMGVQGINNLIVRAFKSYNMKEYSHVIENCRLRGVFDPNVLPYYPYRDDAVSLFNVIQSYVSKIVHHYYDDEEKLKADSELKEWRQELGKSRDRGGVGLDGVPGPNTGFEHVDEVVDTITMIISTCSLGHSAANFQQYEQYAFVPNYAGILTKPPPTAKIPYTEDDILDLLPNMRKTLDILVITKLLSSIGINKLGDFEMQYMYDPIDVKAAEQFRKDLKKLSLEIESRNIDRPWSFPYLDPGIVPNAISI